MSFRILIVDDSAAMRRAIQRAIEISALPVECCLTAQHGREALSVLSNHRVDLLLVDLNMPEMSGDELIRHLRDEASGANLACIPFIVMSADATARRVQDLLELGALTYLPKPFSAEMLRSELGKALEQIHVSN